MAGYAFEKSLSIDNMMVFVAIFSSFGIKGILQHRILYYGIVGALLFRAIFVAAGTAVFGIAPWVELIFATTVSGCILHSTTKPLWNLRILIT